MEIYVYKEGMGLEEQKNGAYFERNMLAVLMAVVCNETAEVEAVRHGADYTPPNGWYIDTDNDWDGWHRVVSLGCGQVTFHVPDDFDLGKLPRIAPNWDGHTTEQKWKNVMDICGMKGENIYHGK